MNILLVEDEAGIREGLATYLQLKGHIVRVADSCASGSSMLEDESFDVVVTDWRLGDGLGGEIAARSECPVVVMTGYPQDVSGVSDETPVLRKPVAPGTLLTEIEKRSPAVAARPKATAAGQIAGLEQLPQDVQDRIRLAIEMTDATDAAIREDGDCVVLTARLERDDQEALNRLQCLGGDIRVLDDNGLRLEFRLFRDAHPVDATVVRFDQPWPAAPSAVAVDLHGCECHPEAFVQLVEDVARANRGGRTVHILNAPPHHRLYLETLGLDHLLPNRPRSGPRLPEVLMELWRDE